MTDLGRPDPAGDSPTSVPTEEHGETRKVQVVGGSTLAISLPKRWVDAVGIRGGDEVVIRMGRDGTLSVEPRSERKKAPRVRVLRPQGRDPEELLRLLTAHYLCGTDVLVVRPVGGYTSGLREIVEQACVRLRGLQVVEEDATSVTLQDLSDAREFSGDKAVRLMQLNVRRLLQDSAQAFIESSGSRVTEAMSRSEAEVDRLLLLLVKQHNALHRDLAFSKRSSIRPEEGLSLLAVATILEEIADVSLRIAQLGEITNRPQAPELLSHIDATAQLAIKALDDAMTSFYRTNIELANETIRLAHDLAALAQRIPMEVVRSPKRRVILPHCEMCLGYASVFEAYGEIGMATKRIAEIAIDHAVAMDAAHEKVKP